MAAGEAPHEQDYAVLERGDGTVTLRFSRQLPHPQDKVWRALTQAEHLAAWFPTTIEGDLAAAGAPLTFGFRHVPMPPMDGRAISWDPPRLLEYLWGDETLRFELTPRASGTLLSFTATFAETGRAARDGAGWHACLDELGYALDGLPVPWTTDERWRLVNPGYVSRFGPDAATVGPPQEWEETYGPADTGSA
ncbi:MAG TPA: SRPBCC family protein [Streptosporangiaceae bacterium]|nr:SRPBCC family protein [Streptosporangiaceae bacterium]